MSPRPLRILVGVDFSDCSAEALRYAVGVARDTHAELDIVHVHPYGRARRLVETVLARDEFHAFMQARGRLAAFRRVLVPVDVPAREHARLGDPAQELLDAVDILQPDVVVVGRHGSGLRRALLGSVSSRVANRCEVAVVVVPEGSTVATTQPPRTGDGVVWSCAACGHAREAGADGASCPSCGARPASWNSSPALSQPAGDEDARTAAPEGAER